MTDEIDSEAVCIAHGGDLSEPSGGTDRVSAFAAGLLEHGYEVSIVAPTPDGALPDRVSEVDFHPISAPTRGVIDQPVRAVRVSRRARRIAADRNAHLQIEHSTLGGAAALLGCHGFILDMHDLTYAAPIYGNLPIGTLIQSLIRRIEGRALTAATDVIVVSERMAELVAATWDIHHDCITIIPNGYFPEVVDPHTDNETVEGRVVFLGTLHRKVDITAILDVARLSAVDEMIVIGDGPQWDALSSARIEYGLDHLRLPGRLPDQDAFELAASAAVAINPQHGSLLQEASSPVKLHYYAALGCPMVLTTGPDIVRMLADNGAAIAVEPDDDFATAVESLLSNDSRRRSMARAAIEVTEDATWAARIDRLLSVYAAETEARSG